ncbi:MAG: hypothetical protein ACI30J_09015 [Paludibacteraceae bacterium]
MEINLDWLKSCNSLRSEIEKSKDLLTKMESPYLTDLSLVPDIHTMLREYLANQDTYVSIRAEVLILTYLYAPSRLARQQKGRAKNKILTNIARYIGISNSSLYMYKASVIQHYRMYKEFREVVDGGIRLIKNKYPMQD